MAKITWKLLLLLIAGGIVFLWLIKAPILGWYLTKLMQVEVSVGSISIWPSETTIRHFSIHNPPEFVDRKALTVKHIQASYQFDKVRNTPHEIEVLQLDSAYFFIDCANQTCSENNWSEIANSIPESHGNGGVIIHKTIITDLTVEFKGGGLLKTFGAITNTAKIRWK